MVRALAAIIIAISLISGCTIDNRLEARLHQISQPYRFSVAGWHWQTYLAQVEQWLKGASGKPEAEALPETLDEESRLVYNYFTASAQLRKLEAQAAAAAETGQSLDAGSEQAILQLQTTLAAGTPKVEQIIQKQIGETIAGLGIYNPLNEYQRSFPPVYFRLETMPSLLIISPRDKIEPLRKITLLADLSLSTKESIEAQADGLNVSSLVDRIGGMATYPSMIDNEASLESVLETAAHEWAHHYLSFTPLGFLYVLDQMGISRDYDIATINESSASIIGEEIGKIVFEKRYAAFFPAAAPVAGSGFTIEMREIRQTTDALLATGKIEEAEAYMESRRLELMQKGYYIRKLNQAYFAFHGTYADSPAFENKIGADLKELRSKSLSLKEFLDAIAPLTGAQALSAALK